MSENPTFDEVDEPTALDKMREQAAEADADFAPLTIKTKTGKLFTIPDANLLDDDQQEAFDELRHEANQCDRWPDREVPEEVITKDGATIRTAAHTRPGDFIQPYQKGGVRMMPSYNIRLAKIFLGSEENYEAFKKAGGRSNEIALALTERSRQQARRLLADPKSDASDSSSAPVSDAD